MADTKTKRPKARIRSIADLLQFWEDLRAAALDKADRLGPASPQVQALEELLPRAREMRARHEALKADTKQLTQDFKALREEGKETVRRLQHAVKANIGTKEEGLSQFGSAPIRSRSRKKATEEQPSGGETPAPTPGPAAVGTAPSGTGGDRS